MEFTIDLQKIKWSESKQTWKFCVGSGNAKLALQSDYQKQLKQVHEELGFKRVRFHGLFNDGLYVVRDVNDLFNVGMPTPHIREYSFQQIGKVLDAIIETGVQPFIELGMMPRVFTSSDKKIFKYNDYISPPKEMKEWTDLIERFIKFIIDRYGLEEVKEWFFEVWNEPDISNFWGGTQEDYFELYANTARTIKKINKELKVGGPSTAKTRWVQEFHDFCTTKNVPIDFISTHQYPGDALGHSFSREKHMEKMEKVLKKESNSLLSVAREILCDEEKIKSYPSNLLVNNARIAKEQAGEFPLYYTEWNTTSICVAPHNDSAMSAAYIVKTCLEVDDILSGTSFWTFSDIFEELAYFTDPFNGAFGLLTIDGIEKPSYYGFKFLHNLGKDKHILKEGDDHIHVSLHRKENELQIIMTNHHFDLLNTRSEEYHFEFIGIEGVQGVTELKINEEDGNSTNEWKKIGSPKPLKKNEIEKIKEQSIPKEYPCDYALSNGKLSIGGKISSNETKLITIKLK